MIMTRGQFDSMRYWGIDMNEACQLYLDTYSHIDYIDNLIKNSALTGSGSVGNHP